MGARAIKIKSQPVEILGISWSMAARSRRFARVRTTAAPTARPAEIPILVVPCGLASIIKTTSGCENDFPFRRTRENSVDCRSRNARFTHVPVRPGVLLDLKMGQDRRIGYQRTVLLTWLFLVTAKRTRPRKRRRFNTARPSAVAIRARKP